jgi:hypothetical protein
MKRQLIQVQVSALALIPKMESDSELLNGNFESSIFFLIQLELIPFHLLKLVVLPCHRLAKNLFRYYLRRQLMPVASETFHATTVTGKENHFSLTYINFKLSLATNIPGSPFQATIEK